MRSSTLRVVLASLVQNSVKSDRSSTVASPLVRWMEFLASSLNLVMAATLALPCYRRSPRDTMDRLQHDIRIALRGFRRTPSFTITAILILAVGIGMAVAMFTVYDAVLV